MVSLLLIERGGTAGSCNPHQDFSKLYFISSNSLDSLGLIQRKLLTSGRAWNMVRSIFVIANSHEPLRSHAYSPVSLWLLTNSRVKLRRSVPNLVGLLTRKGLEEIGLLIRSVVGDEGTI